MLKRKWLRAAFLLSGMAATLAAQDLAQPLAPQDYRPGDVIKVTRHHSRWNYPLEITLPEGTQLHIVQTGDTLWDLGQKYLGNPFAWPQIWEMNQWITDPHWIYPVDHLIIPLGRTIIKPGDIGPEVASGSRLQVRPLRDEYSFAFQDFLQLPYLVPNGAEAHFAEMNAIKIVSKQSRLPDKTELGDLDPIYLDGGANRGLKVGDRLLALKVTKKKLYHPSDKRQSKSLGDVVKQYAVVRVTQVQPDAAVAVIEKSADTVQIGDQLVPFTEPPTMTTRLRTDTKEPIPIKEPAATVLSITDNYTESGTGMMAILDRGTADGLKVGDVLLAVRDRTWKVGPKESQSTAKTNYLIGQLLVVKTSETHATCRILRAYEEINPGDTITR